MVSVNYLCRRLGQRAGVVGVNQGREPAGAAETAPALTIALAREPGTPAAEVAREVGARLGWPVYDHELVERVGRELGVPASQLDDLDERPQGWVLECIRGFTLASAVSESRYVHRLVGVIRSLAAEGRCVIVGRGAAQLLPPDSTLRVCLVGAEGDRVAALARGLHLGPKEAARKAQEISRESARFIRDHFRKDPATPGGYDLVLNTSHWSAAACAALVVQALRCKARTPAEDAGPHA